MLSDSSYPARLLRGISESRTRMQGAESAKGYIHILEGVAFVGGLFGHDAAGSLTSLCLQAQLWGAQGEEGL